MIDINDDLVNFLKLKKFKRDRFDAGLWTRHRWWMFWHAPNGGDMLTLTTNVWLYSPVPGKELSIRFGYSVESLKAHLRSL